MAVFTLAHFEIRPDAGAAAAAEAEMHAFATYVRAALPASTWTAYRDPRAPTHYIALSRADDAAADHRQRTAPGTEAFTAALRPLLAGTVEAHTYELVTSSDLAPRPRSERRAARKRRPQR